MENEISGWLCSYELPENISRAYKSLGQPETLQINEFLSLAHFLYAAGEDQQIMSLFPLWFRRAPQVPWRLFLHILHRQNISLSDQDQKMILEGLQKQNQMESVIFDPICLAALPDLAEYETDFQKSLQQKNEARKAELWEKLEFMRSQRLIEEERRLLRKLSMEFPDDPRIQAEEKNLKELWAREKLSQVRSPLSPNLSRPRPNKEELTVLNVISTAVREHLQKRPQALTDFAILFLQCDYAAFAVELLETRKSSLSSDWLFVDALFQAQYFVRCLEALDHIQQKYQGDSETPFQVIYIRAQCLWALGDKGRAIETLKGLIQLRPHFRSATALLSAWQGDVA